MQVLNVSAEETLPNDAGDATLVGRVWMTGDINGPCVVVIEDEAVYDITAAAPTMSHLVNAESPRALVQNATRGRRLGRLQDFLGNSRGDINQPHCLSPNDLQSIKACGVTFVDSMLERFVEERARGDSSKAAEIRDSLMSRIGGDLSEVVPGSERAQQIKDYLLGEGLWSQYLEVGLGKDAEVFTKSQPMSAVGTAADIGLHPSSNWNNPEPELVLAVNNRGRIVGASLGNDVNLRDIEGRSALLLGRAKDNNGSCAIGPFIRLLDDSFTVDTLRNLDITLSVTGDDGFELNAASTMTRISRDIEDLVSQVIGKHHQYPDGFMLFTGTLYAPIEDRDAPGGGFTHKIGDRVSIHSAPLGSLINRVNLSTEIKPWTFGSGALFENLIRRGIKVRG